MSAPTSAAPDCGCRWAWKSYGRLEGIDMGKGWVLITRSPDCPVELHHGRPAVLGFPQRAREVAP